MSKPGFDQHGPLLEEPRSRPWLTLGLGPRGRGRLGTFRAGFESAGRPRRLAGDRWFRLGARIRKPPTDRAKTPTRIKRYPTFAACGRREEKKSRKFALCAAVESGASSFRTAC